MKSTELKILGLALLIVGLVLCGIGISWLVRPPQFKATARIQVQQTDNYISPSSSSMQMGFDPYFIQTTFEILQSEVVLSNVIASLDLNNKWGVKHNHGTPLKLAEAMTILKGNLILAPVRNTKLISITVESNDPKEAADIANAIADSYKNYRIQTAKQLGLTALKTLKEEYQKKESEIQTLQSNVDELSKATLGEATNQAYTEAKLKLDQLQDQQRLFRAKIDAITVDVSIPNNSTVRIFDPAEPPKSPAGPNRVLGGVLLVIGLISIFAGWLLLKTGQEND